VAGDLEEHVLERLSRVTRVRARKMFGGVGLYSGELFFALIAHDVLYLKVDDRNRADFEVRGMSPFQPFPDKPSTMSYYELPADVLGDPRRLKSWVEKSLDAARAKVARASSRTKRRPVARAAQKLPNIGPASLRKLAGIGVETIADLQKLGSVGAFRALEKRGERPSILLLYALEGALLDLRREQLPDVLKDNLRKRAGRD
jgi:DNA transformation protein